MGLLTFKVVPAEENAAGHSEFGGVVNDKVTPSDVWVEIKKEGDCRLMTGPKLTCAPSCKVGEVCAGNNVCTTAPAGQDAGTMTLTGLASPLTAPPLGKQYYAPFSGAFPPATPGTDIKLSATGGSFSAFSLHASAIDPIEVAPGQVTLDTTKPLVFTWTAPSVASASTRVVLSLDLAHHGNVAAKLICDVADTGSATLPVSMLAALAEQGIAGFPSMSITRRSVTSTTIAPGCVEFATASSVNRELVLPGLTSCQCPGSTCEPCSANQMCQQDYTCK